MTDDPVNSPTIADGLDEALVTPVLRAVPDATILLGPDNTIVASNHAGTDLTDREPAALLGTQFRECFPPGSTYDDLLKEITGAGTPEQTRQLSDGTALALRRQDGTTVPIELIAQPFAMVGPEHTMVILRDLSTDRRREQQLAVAQRLLRHNLRNELTVVKLLAEILVEGVDETYDQEGEELLTAVSNLEAIAEKSRGVERLLDREEVSTTTCNVSDLIQTIIDEFTAAYPSAVVEVDLPGNLAFESVPEAVEIAVRNVVENALEHNTDTAWVAVSANELGDGVELVIEDNGPGIPEHEQAVVRVGEETSLQHGSGIGLWLVKWATDVADGDVFFEPTNEGSRVVLWFPAMSHA